MIKFIPKRQNNNTGTISSFKKNLPAIASSKLANQLNSKFEGKHCPDHPHIDSTILVDMPGRGIELEVGEYCCENFKIKLDMLAANQNPFK